MAATVIINRWTGASAGSATAITGTTNRMSTSDVAAPGTANPIPIPASGTNYSFWVVTRLNATVGPANAINNEQWYTDGTSFGTGLVCSGNTATSYIQATGTTGTTGTQLTTGNYSTITTPVDVTTFVVGSKLVVGGTTLAAAGTGDFGNWVVYQLAVGTTANVGNVTARTFTFVYDET